MLYYNLVRASKDDESYMFYILISESEDSFTLSETANKTTLEHIINGLGLPFKKGIWGRDSMNTAKVSSIMKALGIERSKLIKLQGQRAV